MQAGRTPFRLLFVCTGNVCRSPLAQHLWLGRYDTPDLEISSAGTRALVGAAMPDATQRAALPYVPDGARLDAHRGAQLTAQHVVDADLVIGLAREHRADAVRLVPSAHRKTLTLRELARLSSGLLDSGALDELAQQRSASSGPTSLAERLRGFATVALAERGMGDPPDDPRDDDVLDPYGAPDSVHERSAAQIVAASDRIAEALTRAAIL